MGDTKTADDTGADGGTGTGDGGGTNDTTDTTQTGDKGTQTGGNGTDGTSGTDGAADTVSRADFEALSNRMKAADRRATAAENKVKASEDKDKTELELAKEAAKKAEGDLNSAKADIRSTKLMNAFLANNGTAWHDVGDAFKLLMENHAGGVDIDDQGKVTGMDAAIKSLAKSKAYLVKTGTSEATGTAQNGSRKGDDEKNKLDRAKMAARFPAAFNGQHL
jgi:hypothetical protein